MSTGPSCFQRLLTCVVFADAPTNGSQMATQRPCAGLCTAVQTSCPILPSLGLQTACDMLDASGQAVFDNSTSCHAFTGAAQQALVAEASEPYTGSTCAGITDHAYTFAGNAMAPWLPPGVVQESIESALASSIAVLPRYFSDDCLLAHRKLLCASNFLTPSIASLSVGGFGEVVVPSYPHHSVCTAFTSTCSDSLLALLPALAVDCNATLGGIQLYPHGEQAVASIALANGTVQQLSSQPNYVPTTVTISTQCPYSHAVPDDPNDPDNIMIEHTACAHACPYHSVYTSEEFAQLYRLVATSILMGAVFGTLQLTNISMLKAPKRNVFLLCSVVFGLVYQAILALQLAVTWHTDRPAYCASPTAYTHKDTGSWQAGMCVGSALSTVYLTLLSWWILFGLSSELWLRVVWGAKYIHWHRMLCMYGGLGLVAIQAVVITVYGRADVSQTGLFCTWIHDDKDEQYYVYTLGGTVYFGLSVYFVFHALFVCIQSTRKAAEESWRDHPLLKLWKSYSMLFLFLLLQMIIYPVGLFYYNTLIFYVNIDGYKSSAAEWTACLFSHFHHADDSAYLEFCGIKPSNTVNVSTNMSAPLGMNFIAGMLIFVITLNKDARAFWIKHLHRLLALLGLKWLHQRHANSTKDHFKLTYTQQSVRRLMAAFSNKSRARAKQVHVAPCTPNSATTQDRSYSEDSEDSYEDHRDEEMGTVKLFEEDELKTKVQHKRLFLEDLG